MSNFFKILDVNVSATNLQKAAETIESWIRNKQKSYVCVAPVSTIVDCQKNTEYKEIINDASMVTPDGMPLVWIGKKRKIEGLKRTYGPDLMDLVCSRSQENGISHYFYGGKEESTASFRDGLLSRFPRLDIKGVYSPELKEIGELESENVLSDINNAGSDILWVGLGSPKQDYWMSLHRDKLNVPVMIGVGAAFDYISGAKSQAPKWMQKSGLEWFFRLMNEPGRLWKRYIAGNSLFLYLLLKEQMKNAKNQILQNPK